MILASLLLSAFLLLRWSASLVVVVVVGFSFTVGLMCFSFVDRPRCFSGSEGLVSFPGWLGKRGLVVLSVLHGLARSFLVWGSLLLRWLTLCGFSRCSGIVILLVSAILAGF